MSAKATWSIVLVAAGCLVQPEAQAAERWVGQRASGRLAFYSRVLDAIGARLTPASQPDADDRLSAAFEAVGRLEFDAPGSIFRDVREGSLRLSSRARLRGAGGTLALDGLTLRRGVDERTLELLGPDGQVWFEADHMHFESDRKRGRFRMYNLDVRLTPATARLLGDVHYAELAVAVMEMEVPLPELVGAVEQPLGGCTTPNWGAPHNDVALINISSVQQMARDATPPARIAIAPSATLKNVGTTDVPWFSKFSGVFAPYNNDQHPFLVWGFYRLAGGVIEQVGVSPLKHAFVSTNSNCGCSGGNILWVGCEDTYGTGTNDGANSLGVRKEIHPYLGIWERCGSIFDTNCDGVANSAPRATTMERRMAVFESDLQTAGATYYIDSWYVVRDDVNIFNTMGWRVATPVAPTPPSTQWTFSLGAALTQGRVLDQWVNPAAPGPNADSVPVDTPFGKLRLAVKATSLGGGQWRYEYALMNYDFEPRVKSLRIPLPAGATPSNIGFHDPDADGATDWAASTAGGAITWTAPNSAASQDWHTLYNFRFTVNASPSAVSGVQAQLGVDAARGWAPAVSVMGPGTTTFQQTERE